jgi:hypothetical protein
VMLLLGLSPHSLRLNAVYTGARKRGNTTARCGFYANCKGSPHPTAKNSVYGPASFQPEGKPCVHPSV